MRCIIAAVAASLLSPISGVIAQEPPSVGVGARVRITAPHCGIRRQVAVLDPLRGDTLVLVYGASTALCLRSNVTRLEVSRGRKTLRWVGGFAGAVAGIAMGVWAADQCFWTTASCPSDFAGAAIGGLIGFGGGFMIGGLISSAVNAEGWEEIPLDRLRVRFVPQHGGRFALGMTVSF